METQEHLDKWLRSSINYYNKKSNNKMKTTEERLLQLETAHGRLFNQFNTLHQDFINLRQVMQDEKKELMDYIKQLEEICVLQSNSIEDNKVPALPDNLINGKEYKAVITEIIKNTPTKWKNMEYTNWEVKLQGKDQYVYVAFIPTEYQLQVDDKVRFTYANPFQLRKLKQI